MKISFFHNNSDVKPRVKEFTWKELVAFIESGHLIRKHKNSIQHISGVEFDGYKNGKHAKEMSVLILDYDEGPTIKQALKAFGEYEFILYTSWNHQREKHGHPACDRFRIIFPFKTPCTSKEWERRKGYLNLFAPKVDPASKKFVQCYTLPGCRKEDADKTLIYHNVGKFVDWNEWSVTEANVEKFAGRSVVAKAEGFFDPEHTFRLQGGKLIAAKDINRHIGGVYCDWHDDKSPGCFVDRKGKTTYFHCTKCGTYKMRSPEQVAITNTLKKEDDKNLEEHEESDPPIKEDMLEKIVETPVFPFTRARRAAILKRKCVSRRWNGSLLMYASEGFGKSYLAVLLIKERKKKVVFSSISNAQAEEQAESFRSQGIRTQFIPSRKYTLQKMGFEVEIYDQRHPWDEGSVNKGETIVNIMNSDQCPFKDDEDKARQWAEQKWNEAKPHKPNWEDHDLVCTTMARVGVWGLCKKFNKNEIIVEDDEITDEDVELALKLVKEGRASEAAETITHEEKVFNKNDVDSLKNQLLPEKCIIFYDDPDARFFRVFAPYDSKFEGVRVNGRLLQTKHIRNGQVINLNKYKEDNNEPIEGDSEITKVFVRPAELTVGFGLDDYDLVFTTTELLTKHLIERLHTRKNRKLYIPKLMPDNKMIAGDITMIKTDLVRKKVDGVLPIIMNRLHKDGYDFVYIANAQGQQINLVNNKGQNAFQNDDLVVKISCPHYNAVMEWLLELKWDYSNFPALQLILALDAMQQAIGRNSGYRWVDSTEDQRKRCIVIVDPKLYKRILEFTRYEICTQISDVDTAVGLKREDTTTLELRLCWYLRNLLRYIKDGVGKEYNAFLNDLNDVLKPEKGVSKYFLARRIEYALTFLRDKLVKGVHKDRLKHILKTKFPEKK